MREMFLLLLLIIIEVPSADAQFWRRSAPEQQGEETGRKISLCDDLSNGIEDRMDRAPDSMAGVRQARHQAATPGKFGSCATYTSLARVNAILNKEGIPVPPELQININNIIRTFNAYGRYGRTKGNAVIITGKILSEFLRNHCPQNKHVNSLLTEVVEINGSGENLCTENKASCDPGKITKYLNNYNPNSSYAEIKYEEVSHYPRNSFIEKLSAQFKKEKPRLPIEIIYNSDILWVKPSFIARDDVHASLITGRRKTKSGQCQVLVRNSWKGNCVQGEYSDRECENETDSVWVEEDTFYKGTDSIRVIKQE